MTCACKCQSTPPADPRREEFAKAAMQGLCANSNGEICRANSDQVARWALAHADSLIAALGSTK